MSNRFHLVIHGLLIAFGIFAMTLVYGYRDLVDEQIQTMATMECPASTALARADSIGL